MTDGAALSGKPAGLSPAATEYILAFADDEHMVGARHTTWIGLGPFLEEDLAFCSIAQDELGHAIALYTVVAESEGAAGEAGVDQLALLRAPDAYRSSWLAEWPCNDWAQAVVRHWLYDTAEALRWDAVAASTVPQLAAIVPGAQREEQFHTRHAAQFMAQVCTTAAAQIGTAIQELLPVAHTVWLPPVDEAAALAEGVATRSFAEMEQDWQALVEADLSKWGLPAALLRGQSASEQRQTDRTVRSPGFTPFHQDLVEVFSIDPAAVW